MKKAVLLLTICISLIFSLTACGSDYSVSLYDYQNITVTNAEIDDEINTMLEYYADVQLATEGTVAEGDTINISYVGSMDDVAFEGGTANDVDITVGSSGYIDGFDDGLIGKEVGSTVSLNLTFPDEYSNNPDLAGKDCVFKVTINSLQIKTTPEFNDEWVVTNSETILGEAMTTVDEFRNGVISYLVLNKVFEESTLKSYNKDEYQAMVDDQLEYYQNYADQYGVDLEALLSMYGTSEEELENSVLDTIKWEAIIFEIADLEGIKADDEYEETMLAEAKDAGYETIDEYIKGEEIPDYYVNYTKAYSLYSYIVDLLMDTVTVTD